MKAALVYDRVNKWGGAERELLALNELFPNAPLYTAVYSSKKAAWANVFPKVVPSFLQKALYFKDKHDMAEAIFKAFARALDVAIQVDERRLGSVPSSKGKL